MPIIKINSLCKSRIQDTLDILIKLVIDKCLYNDIFMIFFTCTAIVEKELHRVIRV